jgi:hypothetical protein
VTLADTSIAVMLASTLNLDVMRDRLSTVYRTYLKENFEGDGELDVMEMAEYEYEREDSSVSLAEGFEIWILLAQLYDLAPKAFKTVRVVRSVFAKALSMARG